jgi:putative SOS response-associated peptidase YedK
MCGRVRLSSDVSEIKLVFFSIPPNRPTPNFPPSWNAAQTDLLPAVRYDRRAGEPSLDLLRWGLIPHWARDIKFGFANINAKAEGIENRPAFRDAFERRRGLVPVDSFYEWTRRKWRSSLTTLTTTGYGDILAVDPFVRSVANLELVLGQLFLAITVARLVTMELADRHR